jgi:hypothetical protein
MKKILLTGLVLCLTASVSLASGLNVNWNTSKQCPVAQTGNLTWDCNGPSANDGVFYIVCTVMPTIAVVGFNALDARIDGQSVGAVPAWWQAFNPGSCREAAFTPGVIDVNPTAPCAGTATTKLWTTAAYGGMGAWVFDGANRFHTVVGFATAANRVANLSTTTQYNAFHVAMATTNSMYVAPDPDNAIDEILACAGCSEGMTLVLNQIGLYGSGAEDQVTLPGTTVGATLCLTWQGGAGAGVCSATPSRNTTWGQVKSLYR